MSDCTKNGVIPMVPFRIVLSLLAAALIATAPGCGDDDDTTGTGDDDDDNGAIEPVSECPDSATCTAVSGKFLCLVSGKPSSSADSCTKSNGKTSCPAGLVKANVGDNCFCVLQCLPAGSDTGASDTGSPADDVDTDNQNCKNWINKVCNCTTAPAGACAQVKAAVNAAITAKNEALTCIGKADEFSCPAGSTDTGGNDTGSSDTGGTTGGTGTEDTCPNGTTCQTVQGQGGQSAQFCLAPGTQPPAGAPTCDATTGAGCPSGFDSVGAQDQNGNNVCICLVSCGSTGTTGGTDTGSGNDCSTAGTTCQTVQNQGGGSAQLCLAPGPAIPPGAPTCDASTGAGCTGGLVAVQYQTTQGGPTMCSCVEPCGSSGTTGGTTAGNTTGQQGSCDTGLTCTPIQGQGGGPGGNVCLEGGGLPAGAPACSGNTCASGLVPVEATPAGGGATQCVCLSTC